MCGGNSQDTDRSQELQNYGRLDASGSNNADAGAADTGAASKRFSSILSGDPNAVASAVAPTTNAVNAQENQQKEQISNFGNRSGGTNAATQSLTTNGIGKIADTVTGAGDDAAKSEASIGSGETGAANQADSTLAQASSTNRANSQAAHNAAVSQWADVASTLLLG
jgi:hypothetical protein